MSATVIKRINQLKQAVRSLEVFAKRLNIKEKKSTKKKATKK
jgi:hypothetical protein